MTSSHHPTLSLPWGIPPRCWRLLDPVTRRRISTSPPSFSRHARNTRYMSCSCPPGFPLTAMTFEIPVPLNSPASRYTLVRGSHDHHPRSLASILSCGHSTSPSLCGPLLFITNRLFLRLISNKSCALPPVYSMYSWALSLEDGRPYSEMIFNTALLSISPA